MRVRMSTATATAASSASQSRSNGKQTGRPVTVPRGARCLGSVRVNVLFIAGLAVVAPEPATSRALFVDALGLPLEASLRAPTTSTVSGSLEANTSASGPRNRGGNGCSLRVPPKFP
jgi:hypothetical protein